ncbi:kinase-associated lipoprotein B [Staphylococcus pseudoxylosus]|uniref:sporulation phosphorelay system protein KapB n=1 Tax=Staphylococcus pseudoxylosus TaxID=2282419 RepID=UPI000D1D24EA|nr:sporulation phosphorelay system protein KapB [Staphylococcus pseudoxylosus]PTI46007.1 kinase [Staphylococcus xylosus]MDW8799252.1 sporulation phosphorelay system protein KapB [Staphylococcus pseudoxylosus]MDW8799259.1 sporulation phosphorelay system protein KapB [Staphylococcus pseudoxylosus]MEB6037509.1 kinase-associated lipoprotein B [Staphylococcus pseudoxylosus]MEB6045924.1 kinase-associated lipoprotein B [Staphylococcus pseudoxylosus]
MLYRFSHKTGSYGVTIKEANENSVLVQVEQVINHPKQGDLHNPTETENVFFHERKALSHYEKRYTTKSHLRAFNVETMPYTESLQQAISKLEAQLKTQNTLHATMSLDNLQRLKHDYSIQYKQNFE